jgi:CheY-like chemotaxis protein
MNDSALLQAGLRVIVVDNDRDSRELLTSVLNIYGVETIAVSCVRDLFEIMQYIHPNLLISEILLPGEDGYTLIHRLKTFEAEHHVQIPAIALTVCATKEDRTHVLAAGFCEHLTKPLDIDTLVETVAEIADSLPASAQRATS